MEPSAFGAKPAVLRCARCGRFVDWTESRLQVVCDCRPRLDLPPVFVRSADDSDRGAVSELFARDFGHTGKIVAFGDEISLDAAPALVAGMRDELGGALVYRLLGNALHIVALATDPMWQRAGVGGHLLAEAQLLAKRLNLQRLLVAMSNDNLPALYFYQRHGFELLELVPGAMLSCLGREVTGFGGIPIRDEIRLQKTF